MIGSTPGGAVDRFSRVVGPYLAKHMGAKIVLQNRPGGGGTFAFNYLYNMAKKDGLRLAFHIGSTQALNIISDQPGLRFNFEELSYIGVISSINNTMMAYAKRFRTLEDLKRAGDIRYGMTHPGGNVHFLGVVLKKILGLKLQFVSGYSGSSAVRQVLLSREVDVATYPASSAWSYVNQLWSGANSGSFPALLNVSFLALRAGADISLCTKNTDPRLVLFQKMNIPILISVT